MLLKISLSDANFYQKILRKYQKGKWNLLNFPFIVLGKNLEQVFPQKFNINLYVHLNFHNQRLINYSVDKSIKGMKEWVSGVEKILIELGCNSDVLRIIKNIRKSITFQHETISGFSASMSNLAYGQSKKVIFPIFLFNTPSLDIGNYGSMPTGKARINILSSDLFDQSSHISSYRNLFLNKILQNGATYPRNITLSGGTLSNQNLIYSNNIQNINLLISGHNAIKYPPNISSSGGALKNKNLNLVLRQIYDREHLTETNSHLLNKFTSIGIGHLFKIIRNFAEYYSKKKLNNSLLQTFYDVSSINQGNYLKLANSKAILLDFEAERKYYLFHNKNFIGNSLIKNDSSRYSITLIHPPIRRSSIRNSSNSFNSISMQRKDVQNNDNFYFQNHRQMDQKIEQIKKISQEAKEIVTKKFLSDSSEKASIQPEIDIKRLSDKVYKMIEYNLKIEKERRGYL
jgi:hypothetical protein